MIMISYLYSLFDNSNCIIEQNNLSGGLWLGNYKAGLDPNFLKDNDITVIVNCSVDIPYIYDILDVSKYGMQQLETFRIPVEDSLLEHDINVMYAYFSSILPFLLTKLVKEKKNVFIGCRAGAQRSAIVVTALLFVIVDNNLLEIKDIPNLIDKSELMKLVIKYVLVKRPRAFSCGFRINFKDSIERYFNIHL